MPHYYFDVDDGEQKTVDDIGVNCSDIEAARREASRALSEIAQMHMPDRDDWTYDVRIRDETGQPVLSVKLTLTARSL